MAGNGISFAVLRYLICSIYSRAYEKNRILIIIIIIIIIVVVVIIIIIIIISLHTLSIQVCMLSVMASLLMRRHAIFLHKQYYCVYIVCTATPTPGKRSFKYSSWLYIQHIWTPVTHNLFRFRNQLAYDVILHNIVSLLTANYHMNQHL